LSEDFWISPEVLIIGARYDFACDYVVAELRDRNVPHLRLNIEDLPSFNIVLDPLQQKLMGRCPALEFEVSQEKLRWIIFRRPVFLRTSSVKDAEVSFQQSQWAAFTRALMIFEKSSWMNHPAATYLAETKPLQLLKAEQVGFDVPATLVANVAGLWVNRKLERELVAVKGLDTVLLQWPDREAFAYTQIVDLHELGEAALSAAPVVIQEALTGKLDVRVTVVGNKVFAAEISEDGRGVEGDWRLRKASVTFAGHDLPDAVGACCVALTQALGLTFSAIDLALMDAKYYFLELNPTGEWVWLVDAAGLAIDEAIAELVA
jgi:glutathione synthase/RimK-type ligase-like ATP-grasp enzyme